MIDIKKIADPEFFKENRLAPHSDHKTDIRVESLNGLWKFKYARNIDEVTEDFWGIDYDCHAWEEIRVPAHEQMEGYDGIQYANLQYPWDGREACDPGEIPVRYNPVGCYVNYIWVSENELKTMKAGSAVLSFQGVESGFSLWINGKYAGYSEGSFMPADFDITTYLVAGENKIALAVYKWCASSWGEDQDFFRFSGIFRDVKLEIRPSVHLEDLYVRSYLSDDFGEATVNIAMKMTAAAKAKLVVKYLGRTDLGCKRDSYPEYFMPECEQSVCELELSLIAGENKTSVTIANPVLWSAESPKLYELAIELADTKGNVIQKASQIFGIRKFVIEDGLMKLNGKRIVFKGVNRHEFSGISGRVPNLAELWQDIVTIKQNNMNAIRTCHYPNNSPIYELCDRVGLYMIDETDLESHGSWDKANWGALDKSYAVPGYRMEWKEMMLDRAQRMYERDKNHPSILIWSCGNEAYGGPILQAISDYFHSVDDTRIVQYEGVFNDRRCPDISDVESQMYTTAEGIKEWLAKDNSKPFIMIEYTHAMGNSCGAMHKYTELTDTLMQYQGGFIWDYVDQSINTRDRYGVKFQAYGGDFNDRPADYNFSGNGIVYGGSRLPSPKIQEVKFNYRNFKLVPSLGKDNYVNLKITNNSLFTNANEYNCIVTIMKDGVLVYEKTINSAGDAKKLDVAPGSTKLVKAVCQLPEEDGEFVVTASLVLKNSAIWSDAGLEVAYGQDAFVVKKKNEFISLGNKEADLLGRSCAVNCKELEIIKGNYNIGVRGEHFEALFSLQQHGMQSYRYGGVELFKSAPKPNFWRAPIDNDYGNGMPLRYGQWKLASMYQTKKNIPENPIVTRKDDCVEVVYELELGTSPVSFVTLTYNVYPNGAIKVNLHYDPVKKLGDMPEFGVMFKLDADYDQLEWYGKGPDESYVDRDKGAKLGKFSRPVADGMAAYMVPQECGNLTGVRYAKVTNEKGRGLMFAGDGIHFSALPYSPHEMENALHPTELPPVQYTYIRAALSQMGVGGDNSWGARTHDEYLINVKKPLDFTFTFKGI